MKIYQNYIGGKVVSSGSAKKAPLYNPTNGNQIGEVVLSAKEDLAKAVEVAKAAFPNWAGKTPLTRARVMMKFCSLVSDNTDELAKVLSEGHGKVFSDAKGEIVRGLEVAEFSTAAPHLLKGEHSMNVGTGVDSWSSFEPLGVVCGITPFNFPFMVPLWMHGIAIPCGNAFVLKPSEKDPQISFMVAELYKQAGLPDGIFNVVNGDKVVVDALLEDKDVQAVSFVGSTPIAKYIYEKGCSFGKRVQALGGAKNHMVVMPDADIEHTINSLIGSAYGSAGERCMAISVVVAVGAKVADTLVTRIKENLKNLVVGASLATDPESEMGPLITKEHRNKVKGYVDLGVEEGAELVVDGRNLSVAGYESGFFLGACLFDRVKPNMRIYQEEIFGPVLSVVRVNSYKEAVELINNQRFANGTSIFTKDGEIARNFSTDIQIGMVGVNVPIPVPMAFHSFGGWKNSIFGALNVHGSDGIRFYTRMKTVTSRWVQSSKENQFAIPTMQ